MAAGLVSSAASAQDSLMQLSSFLSFESEGGLPHGSRAIAHFVTRPFGLFLS